MPNNQPTGIFCRDCKLITPTPETWHGLAICPKCRSRNVQIQWPFYDLQERATMPIWGVLIIAISAAFVFAAVYLLAGLASQYFGAE